MSSSIRIMIGNYLTFSTHSSHKICKWPESHHMATCYYIYSLKLLEKILKVFAKYSKSKNHICNLQYLCEIILLLLSEANFTNINFMLCYDRPVTLTIEQTLGSYHETSNTLSSLKHTPWFRHLQLYPIKEYIFLI